MTAWTWPGYAKILISFYPPALSPEEGDLRLADDF